MDDGEHRASSLAPPSGSSVAPAPHLALPPAQALDFRAAPRAALGLAAPLGVASPPLSVSFPGPSSGIPPDPVIAAGPDALVTITNDQIALLTKTGVPIAQRAPDGFDPKVLFDPHAERFFALALNGTLSPFSTLRIRVSKSSTPTNLRAGPDGQDDWWAYAIDADLDGGIQVNNTWADFPGLGVDQDNLYVTANMIANGGEFPAYVKVWIIPKAGLMSGGPLTVFEYGAPPGPRLANPVTGSGNVTIMPSTNFDLSPEHMVATPLETAGAFGRSTLWAVNDPSATPMLAGSDLLLPGWNGPAFFPCPQLGGGTGIDSGLVGTPHIVERNGSLWVSHTSPNAAATRSEIHWYEIDPTGPVVLQSGQIADPTRCYFYSAIQPDGQGNVAVVMSGVDATIYPSAFYAARLASDPLGGMRSVAVLRAGLSNYDQAFGGRNRWGDYGGIAADPVSDLIWMFHEYATGTPNVSGTWVGGVSLLQPVDTSSFILGRARLRANTSARSRSNGRIAMRGVLDANDLNGDLYGAVNGGLVVRVSGGGLPQAERMDFAPGDCVQAVSGAIRCDGADAQVRFRPFGLGPNLFRLVVTARRRSFPAPLSPTDVVGVLAFGGVERQDRIGDCTLSGRRSQLVQCKESGVVVRTVTPSATATPTAMLPPTATPAPFCGGDCDGSDLIAINELIIGLNILLGRTGAGACAAADIDADGAVTIDESVAAVGNALEGCVTHPSGPPGSTPVNVELGVVAGSAGAQVTFGATLLAMGQSVAGTQNDISFNPLTPIVSCHPNLAINKGATSFAFLPNGCMVGVDCTGVRTAVLALDNLNAIPNGSTLYTCTVAISPSAPDGIYPLLTGNLVASTPGGRRIVAFGFDGAVVSGGLPPTPTWTSPVAPTLTATPTPTP